MDTRAAQFTQLSPGAQADVVAQTARQFGKGTLGLMRRRMWNMARGGLIAGSLASAGLLGKNILDYEWHRGAASAGGAGKRQKRERKALKRIKRGRPVKNVRQLQALSESPGVIKDALPDVNIAGTKATKRLEMRGARQAARAGRKEQRIQNRALRRAQAGQE
jgi:hypothetical protein